MSTVPYLLYVHILGRSGVHRQRARHSDFALEPRSILSLSEGADEFVAWSCRRQLGAAAGIGLALVNDSRPRDCRWPADRDGDALDKAADALRSAGTEMYARVVDVANRSDMTSFADEVHGALGPVTVLCNNAGVSGPLADRAWEVSPDEWLRVIGTNFLGVVNGVSAFVPAGAMVASGLRGHIVNTASELGLIPSTGTVCYTASKHAVVALSESMQLQFLQAEIPIHVTDLVSGPRRHRHAGERTRTHRRPRWSCS